MLILYFVTCYAVAAYPLRDGVKRPMIQVFRIILRALLTTPKLARAASSSSIASRKGSSLRQERLESLGVFLAVLVSDGCKFGVSILPACPVLATKPSSVDGSSSWCRAPPSLLEGFWPAKCIKPTQQHTIVLQVRKLQHTPP